MTRRIAIQCWLPNDEPSGARTRLHGLLRGLGRLPEAARLDLLLLASRAQRVDPELTALGRALPRATILRVDIAPRPTWRRALAEARVLPHSLAAQGVDVLDLQSLPVPALPVPAVVTIHDLRDLGRFARGLRRVAAPALVGRAVRRAARILVPSPPVGAELARRFPDAAAKVDVVPAGLDPRPPASCEPRHFLHVGRPEPRKALPFLLAAYAAARRTAPDLPGLVLAGTGPRAAWKRLAAQARALDIAGHVRFVLAPADADRDTLYGQAVALLFPSRLEGFGLPVLEALAAGVPAVVAAGGVPAWVAGEAGIALPEDVPAWAEAMLRLGRDRDLRADLARRTPARAATFGPERTARAWLQSIGRAARARPAATRTAGR